MKSVLSFLFLVFLAGCGASTGGIEALENGTGSNTSNFAGTHHVLFITSGTIAANPGVDQFDTHCNNLAAAAGYTVNFKALVSTTTENAVDRVTITKEIRNTLGQVVADNSNDLFDGTLDFNANYDENGVTRNFSVWSGSDNNGVLTGTNCNDWSGVGGTTIPGIGPSTTDWLIDITPPLAQVFCSSSLRIFCLSETAI